MSKLSRSNGIFKYLGDKLSGRSGFLIEYRKRWGKQNPNIYRNFKTISTYFRLTADPTGSVDDKTWNDLDMDEVFGRIENSVTPLGGQYLYKCLRTYEHDIKTLAKRFSTFETFRTNAQLREGVQFHLLSLETPDSTHITELLFDERPVRSISKPLIYLIAALSLGSLIAAIIKPVFFLLFFAFVALNFFVTEKYSHGLYAYSQGLTNLTKLLRVAYRLGRDSKVNDLPELQELAARRLKIGKLRWKFGVLPVLRSGTNDLVNSVTYYLNLLCLIDLVVFLGSIRNIEKFHSDLVFVYERIASIDAAISVASYLESIDTYCNPSLSSESRLQMKGCYHPLLENPKTNSLDIAKESMLITGTNMAGKTTFIKTIGVNVILGQTIWMSHAESALIPKMSVRSSIKRQDSLSEGKSYYLVEIEDILGFIQTSNSKSKSLFLIDEIFRGTNTIERIAASTSVLNALGSDNIVFVTSHDVELQHLLDGYSMYHFREEPNLKEIFDYQLREGPSKTRNAIKLLELVGYPENIVYHARRVAHMLDGRQSDDLAL